MLRFALSTAALATFGGGALFATTIPDDTTGASAGSVPTASATTDDPSQPDTDEIAARIVSEASSSGVELDRECVTTLVEVSPEGLFDELYAGLDSSSSPDAVPTATTDAAPSVTPDATMVTSAPGASSTDAGATGTTIDDDDERERQQNAAGRELVACLVPRDHDPVKIETIIRAMGSEIEGVSADCARHVLGALQPESIDLLALHADDMDSFDEGELSEGDQNVLFAVLACSDFDLGGPTMD